MRETLSTRLAKLLSPGALFVLLLFGVSPWPAAGQGSFSVDDLGVLPGDSSSVATGINQRGDVVGWSTGADGTPHAFIYTDSMVALPGLLGRPRTIARDVNDVGQVVGTANAGGVDLGHAVLWSGGQVTDLGTLGNGSYSEGWGLNNNGQVVGSSDGGSSGVHGFLYTPGARMVDLTPASDTGYAFDINDAGQVTGYRTAVGGYHAFRWQDGTAKDLGVIPGFAHSFGWAINATGQVAGSSVSASGNSERVFRYSDGVGVENLGGVGEINVGYGINSWGDVVGYGRPSAGLKRAFARIGTMGLRDLNELIDPSLGWFLLAANDINDAGQIVGYGLNNFTGQTHAVRLQPTTGPPPQCTYHCLRSTNIALSARLRKQLTVTGSVTVKDETGRSLSGAMVVGSWTQTNGTTGYQYAWTDSRGVATFTTTGPHPATYTLEVVNIVLSLYTFNPSQSVLSGSITLAK